MNKRSFPSAHTILLIIAAMVAVLTWFIPAGSYQTLAYDTVADNFIRISGQGSTVLPATSATLQELNIEIPLEKFTTGAIYKPIAIPGTYKEVASNPQGIAAFLQSPVKGIIAAADIIFLVLFIGGLIGIMRLTGAFDAGIVWLTRSLSGREYILIILVTALVAAGGTTFGLAEETLAFLPILVPVFIAAGYDAMVGLACVFMGSAIGTMCSTTNPFSVIIASNAAGINWTTGLPGRFAMLMICLTITIAYILWYAKRVKSDPSRSVIYDRKEDMEKLFDTMPKESIPALTMRLRLILLVFTLTFVVMIVGVSQWDWWFVEMTATFFTGALLIGLIGKISETKFLTAFMEGAGELLSVAFIIGIARGVSILMDDGLISATVLYQASEAVAGVDKGIFANLLFLVYNGLSFFIPSSSGMAVLTMPIMAPLADTVGIGREIIVNAYQYGMGIFAIINPTSLILASLGVVQIGYDRWWKFIWPLLVILVVVTMVVLTISVI